MSSADHIIILQNGLSGHHWRMHSVAVHLREMFPGTDFAIVISDVNNLAQTYFGIEPCGERLRDMVKQQCNLHPLATKISFIGHSLGGLMIRYCIGLLQDENFFGSDRSVPQLQPLLYISVASPHLGVQGLGAFRQALARWAIPGTGAPLLLEDDGQLLLEMSRPESKFIAGLQLFQLFAYGNLFGDTLVPMETACLCDETSMRLYPLQVLPRDDVGAGADVAADAVEVGQLVRVEQPADAHDCDASNAARVIRNNLRRLPWNCYAVNLKGWLAPHNAICNKSISQTLGISRQTVVLDHIVSAMSSATGTQPQRVADQPSPNGGCRVM
jgi:hypothetical protein